MYRRRVNPRKLGMEPKDGYCYMSPEEFSLAQALLRHPQVVRVDNRPWPGLEVPEPQEGKYVGDGVAWRVQFRSEALGHEGAVMLEFERLHVEKKETKTLELAVFQAIANAEQHQIEAKKAAGEKPAPKKERKKRAAKSS